MPPTKKTPLPIDPVRAALEEFVHDIESTDGVWMDKKGNPRPIADPDWIDIGWTYLHACTALGVKPKISKVEPEGWT